VHQLQRFIPIGLKMPLIDEQALSSLNINENDLILLSDNLKDYGNCLEGTVPLLHLQRASAKLKRPLCDVVQRFQQFVPFGLELPALDWKALLDLGVTDDDFLMLSKYLDGDIPLLEGNVSQLHIARAADLRNESVTETYARFKQFAPVFNLNLPEEDPESWNLDSPFQF
jgi:hypothetical protein